MLSAKIVFFLWKIFGLCPYRLGEKQIVRFSYIGLFYSIALSVLYTICFVRAMLRSTGVYGAYRSPMSKISDLVASTSECLMVVITWLTFAFSQYRFRSVQKSFRKIIQSCAKLGISETPVNAVRKVSKMAVVFNSTWSLCFILGNLYPPENFDIVIWIPFNLGHVVYPNFIFLYIGTMRSLHDLFVLINTKLREISEFDTTIANIRESIGSKRSLNCGIESCFTSDHLATLGRVHTDLVELTKYIIDLLSPSLYTTVSVHVFQMSSIFYAMCVGIKEGRFSRIDGIFFYLGLHFAFGTHVLGLIGEVTATEYVTKEANDTANILHELLTSQPTKQNIESGTVWSLRMLQSPLDIKLFDVIPMKASLIYTIAGSITGYATIMLQLDELERPKNVARI